MIRAYRQEYFKKQREQKGKQREQFKLNPTKYNVYKVGLQKLASRAQKVLLTIRAYMPIKQGEKSGT